MIIEMTMPVTPSWGIVDMGYEPKTTFWQDFSIADTFGPEAVRDTYKRAFDEWHTNTEFVTELTLVLNWKIWQHYGRREELAVVYDELWKKCDRWCCDNLTGEDLSYFYSTTD